MYTIGIDGQVGKVSSPIKPALSIFRQGAIFTPDMPTRPIFVTTNGEFEYTEANRMSSLVGRCRMPVAHIFKGKWTEAGSDLNKVKTDFIDPVCEWIDKNLTAAFYEGNGVKSSGPNARATDIVAESINKVPKDGPVIYMDRSRLNIVVDRIWFNTFCNELQYIIQDKMNFIRSHTTQKPIGLGFFNGKEKWEKRKVPSMFIKVGSRTVVKVQPTTLDLSPHEGRVQAAYMYLLAYLMHEFAGIKEYNINDEVAFANLLVGSIVGFGDTVTTKHYTSTDDQTTIDHTIGFGYTMANRYMWGYNKDGIDVEDYKKYFIFCVVLGIVTARVRPTTMDYEIVKFINNDHLVHDRFKRQTNSNIPGFGNFGNMVMLMPRNDFRFNEEVDQAFPVIVQDDTFTLGSATEKEIIEKANVYVELPKYKQVSWDRLIVDRGELPANAIDYTSNMQKHVVLVPSNDARVLETTYPMREVIGWMFPVKDQVINGLDNYRRKMLWRIGILSNGDSTFTQGYITDVSHGLLDPVIVRYFSSTFDELSISKEDSDTRGEQMPKPGSVIAGPVVSETKTPDGKPDHYDVKTPPVQPLDKLEAPKTTEKPTGEKVEESKA